MKHFLPSSSIARAMGAAVVLAAAPLVLQLGCVRRTMTITTAPEGAMVRLNDQDIGRTPVTVDFTWYGDYELIFEKDGYETVQTHRRLDTPWYQVPPIDLVAEAFVPYTIHDHHDIHEELAPATQPTNEELVGRAREFRDRTLYGTE